MTEAPRSTFVYVTYIRTTPEKLWAALTDVETMKSYWFGMHCESEFQIGSPWRLVFPDGRVADQGEILDCQPQKRLLIKWRHHLRPELTAEGFSTCAITLEPANGAVKLTVLHLIDREGSKLIEAVSGGWPQILSNLKSLLETGEIAVKR
jgi:uncharacterized protein YndB with AHSA1/START domain